MIHKLVSKILLILVLACSVQIAAISWAGSQDAEIDAVLSSAESIFKAMNSRDYAGIWQFLSMRSHNKIADDVFKAEGGSSSGYSKEMIEKDFYAGAALSKAYWDAYLSNFDPDTVLQQSRWEIDSIRDNDAGIRITFKKAAAPAILQMFREDGRWKVGLVESFGTKK